MTMKARYTVIDGEVVAEKRNGVRSLYVSDPLGSTVALLDNTQAQTDMFSYWPYGENNGRIGITATPFQFVGTAGYYRDSSSQNYVRARLLNTKTGRWFTRDPLGFNNGDVNFYNYAANNPVTKIDPTGAILSLVVNQGLGGPRSQSLPLKRPGVTNPRPPRPGGPFPWTICLPTEAQCHKWWVDCIDKSRTDEVLLLAVCFVGTGAGIAACMIVIHILMEIQRVECNYRYAVCRGFAR